MSILTVWFKSRYWPRSHSEERMRRGKGPRDGRQSRGSTSAHARWGLVTRKRSGYHLHPLLFVLRSLTFFAKSRQWEAFAGTNEAPPPDAAATRLHQRPRGVFVWVCVDIVAMVTTPNSTGGVASLALHFPTVFNYFRSVLRRHQLPSAASYSFKSQVSRWFN